MVCFNYCIIYIKIIRAVNQYVLERFLMRCRTRIYLLSYTPLTYACLSKRVQIYNRFLFPQDFFIFF